MLTVCVTGCCGYIGSILSYELLRHGYKVIGVDSLFYKNGSSLLGLIGHPRFQFCEMDVREIWKVKKLYWKADAVIPLAALVGAPLCDKYKREAVETNQTAIEDIVKELSANQRLIYPTTNSSYGTGGEQACTEESFLIPLSLYAQTKWVAERAVFTHPDSVSLRLATVFGASPRMRFDLLVNDFTRRITQYEGLILFEPNFRRNFVHIRDICRAFIFMLGTTYKGTYNVGLDAANMTKLQLAHTICDVVSIDRDCVKIGEGEDPDKRDYIVSNAKLLNTGFTFEYSLEQGIREVASLCDFFPAEELRRMGNV